MKEKCTIRREHRVGKKAKPCKMCGDFSNGSICGFWGRPVKLNQTCTEFWINETDNDDITLPVEDWCM